MSMQSDADAKVDQRHALRSVVRKALAALPVATCHASGADRRLFRAETQLHNRQKCRDNLLMFAAMTRSSSVRIRCFRVSKSFGISMDIIRLDILFPLVSHAHNELRPGTDLRLVSPWCLMLA